MTDPRAATRARMRATLQADRCVMMGSVFDPLSARIADDLGYEAALMGGSLVSHVLLAAPDLILTTLTELAQQVERCARVSTVPILVDCDHGFGNALSVMRTVEALDRAGAAAVQIEDTLLPRPYGPSESPSLLSRDESTAKIAAAVEARGASDLIVMGRTGAAAITGIDDAVARFKAFEQAGVDALFIPALKARTDLEKIAAATRLPIVLGGASGDLADPRYLASQRVRLWSAGHQVFNVALQALYDAMRSVLEGTLPAKLPGAASAALIDRLLDVPRYRAHTHRFLGGSDS